MSERRRRHISPEAREKLSRLAKQRHAEGKFNLTPELYEKRRRTFREKNRRERIAKRVAEAAADDANARAIIEVFKDAIHPNQPMQTRLKGAEAWAKLAMEHARFELHQEVQDAAQHSREELLEILSDKLTNGPAARVISAQLEQENIAEAEIVEEEEDAAA
jgi:hypothetical protein